MRSKHFAAPRRGLRARCMRLRGRRLRAGLARSLLVTLLCAVARAQQPPAPRAAPDPPPPGAEIPVAVAAQAPDVGTGRAFVQELAGTVVSLELRPVAPGLWMSSKEITWEAYDVLVYGLDQPAASASPGQAPPENGADGKANEEMRGPDAALRPTKPHMTADRGWGHTGFPAMSLSVKGAQSFCEWLSVKTGRRYRLPTEAEWEAACRAGAPANAAWSCGDEVSELAEIAWYKENAGGHTHAAGTLAANALGLFDMHGNVAEWCLAADGNCVLRGGSFRDASKLLRCDARALPLPTWNRSDPNLPKSVWWLADAPFAGFRIVCEGEADEQGAPRALAPAAPATAPR
jgi:formylglycine-generating enzyme required for sulfatase activity